MPGFTFNLARKSAVHPAVLTICIAIFTVILVSLAPGPARAAAEDIRLLERSEQQQEMERLVAEQRYALAIKPAAAVLESTRQLYGNDSDELIVPLLNLANLQRRTGDYESARNNYSECITLIDQHKSILDRQLLPALVGLGDSYNYLGRHDLAALAYNRALNVSHANEGFYNIDQINVRDGLAFSLKETGDLEKANFHMEAQQYIYDYRYGENNPKVVPILFKLAGWYGSTRQPEKQLQAYRSAFKIMEREEGKNNPDLIDALRYIAKAYLSQPAARGADLKNLSYAPNDPTALSQDQVAALDVLNGASAALKKAVKIAEAQEPQDTLLYSELLAELGDVYTLFAQQRTAKKYYLQAWDILAAEENSAELLEQFFGRPQAIGIFDLPETYPDNRDTRRALALSPGDFGSGSVFASFDVSTSGSVKNVEVIDSNPAALVDRRVKRGLKYARYRPVYIDREPTKVTNMVYRHDFNFDLAAMEEEDDESFEPLPNPNAAPSAETEEAG